MHSVQQHGYYTRSKLFRFFQLFSVFFFLFNQKAFNFASCFSQITGAGEYETKRL